MFRTPLIVHLSDYFMLALDVIYEVCIYLLTIPASKGRNFSKIYLWQRFSNSIKLMSSNMHAHINFIHLREIISGKKQTQKTHTKTPREDLVFLDSISDPVELFPVLGRPYYTLIPVMG